MVYFIEAVGAGLLKIGFTDRDPEARLRELQTGCPHTLRLVGCVEGDVKTEQDYHSYWGHLRTTGEWFRVDDRLKWYLGWIEFGVRHLGPLRYDIAGISEREEYLTEQVNLLWAAVRDLESCESTRVRGASERHADCRM